MRNTETRNTNPQRQKAFYLLDTKFLFFLSFAFFQLIQGPVPCDYFIAMFSKQLLVIEIHCRVGSAFGTGFYVFLL